MTTIREYQVSGMTCAHCVQSVQEAVSDIDGVRVASANLDLGLLTVAGEDFTDDDVRGAVEDAGYVVTV